MAKKQIRLSSAVLVDTKTKQIIKTGSIETAEMNLSVLSKDIKSLNIKLDKLQSEFIKGGKSKAININSKKLKNTLRSKNNSYKQGLLHGDFTVFKIILDSLLYSVNQKELLISPIYGLYCNARSINQVQLEFNSMITNLGIKFGTSKFKSSTQYCITLIEKGPSEAQKIHPEYFSTGTTDRWPKCFNTLRPLYHQVRDNGPYSKVGDQIIRSIFNMPRVIEGYSETTIDSIEYKAEVNLTELQKFKEFATDLIMGHKEKIVGLELKYDVKPPMRFMANGPNKENKLETALYEAKLLSQSSSLYPSFKKLCESTGNKNFLSFFDQKSVEMSESSIELEDKVPVYVRNAKIKTYKDSCLRKIVGIPDAFNKSRVVAILDYWTQCLCFPFGKNIERITAVLYPNCVDTFDHKKGFDKLYKQLKPGIRSDDAVSWTDKFTVKVQKIIVKLIFEEIFLFKEFTKYWSTLVVHCKWKVGNTDKQVIYNTGQGMGTNGSFAIATLSYLMLREFLMRKHYDYLPKDISDRSTIHMFMGGVGDDSWGLDPEKKICDDLESLFGIPFNENKSKEATDENLVCEYVSRNVNKGVDVSRISLNLSRQVGQNIFYLSSLFHHIEERTSNFEWHYFINEIKNHKNDNGNPLYKDHIWSSYYRSLIVLNIIDGGNDYYIPLINNISNFVDKQDSSNIIFGRNFESYELLKILLMLNDCEYMYSQVIKAHGDLEDYFESKIPFIQGKLLNYGIWNDEFIDPITGIKDLSKLHIYDNIRWSVQKNLSSLDITRVSGVSDLKVLINALVEVQGQLENISGYAVLDINFSSRIDAVKYRMDRSHNIQKKFLNTTWDVKLIDLFINSIPCLSATANLSKQDFAMIVHEYENSCSSAEDELS
jgi:hypothetical protein